jgi:hypothetical protein
MISVFATLLGVAAGAMIMAGGIGQFNLDATRWGTDLEAYNGTDVAIGLRTFEAFSLNCASHTNLQCSFQGQSPSWCDVDIFKASVIYQCESKKLAPVWISALTGVFVIAMSLKGLWTSCSGMRFFVLSEAILVSTTLALLAVSVAVVSKYSAPFAQWIPCTDLDDAQKALAPAGSFCMPNDMTLGIKDIPTLSAYMSYYVVHYVGVALAFLATFLHMYGTTATFQYGGLADGAKQDEGLPTHGNGAPVYM